MKILQKSIFPFGMLFMLSLLTSCVSGGLGLINGMAKFGHYKSHLNLNYSDKPLNTLNLYIPEDREVIATVVFFYGGCWGQCSNKGKDSYLFIADTLSKQGYAVVIADYRSFPEVHFDDIILDAKLVTQWTINHIEDYGINSKDIFIMGHSSGAHIGAMLVDDESILGDDLAQINGFIGLAGPYDFYPFNTDYMYELFSSRDYYYASQPVNFINGNEPPHLILHGENDNRVHPNNAERVAKMLQKYNIEHEMIMFKKMSHAKIMVELSKPLRRRSPVLKNIVTFINNNLD
ncbi:MAG: alpha/beta hydrolase [Alcanivoracaceae bacterium]|nr:alpha/beta hydrolase [Alcanivoracaceae bacterium]